MGKFQITTNPENCTGCLRCQLACSEHNTKRFNPSAARIQVIISDAECTITFAEDCTGCGVCADNCLYDALQKIAKEEA